MAFLMMEKTVKTWQEAFQALLASRSAGDALGVPWDAEDDVVEPGELVSRLYWNVYQGEGSKNPVSLLVEGTSVSYMTSGGLRFGWSVRQDAASRSEIWNVWVEHPRDFYDGSGLYYALARAGFVPVNMRGVTDPTLTPEFDPVRTPLAVEKAHDQALYAAKSMPHIHPDLSGGVYDPDLSDDEDDDDDWYEGDRFFADGQEYDDDTFLGQSTLAKLRLTNLFGGDDDD